MARQLTIGEVADPVSGPTVPEVLPPGLLHLAGWLPDGEADDCVRRLDVDHAEDWLGDLTRRVQHHGYRYDYRARRIDRSMELGPLPDWLRSLSARVGEAGGFPHAPDQVIVNEYEPGQGIAAHVDCEPCFGDRIATLSLLSTVVMRFDERDGDGRVDVPLTAGSLSVMGGPSRYDWTHAIPARKSDVLDGVRVQRSRRISLTFRCVVLDG